jgi:DNA replicative helicase MCM subunit Mcm2 (Cdc46/Mcm family)
MSTTDAPEQKETNRACYSMHYMCTNCKRRMLVYFDKGTTCPIYAEETKCETCGCLYTLKLMDD